MWDFLLLLPGAKKQPNHLERDPCPWGATMRGWRGIPWEASQCVLSRCLAHSQHQEGSTGHRRRLSLSRNILKKKTGY